MEDMSRSEYSITSFENLENKLVEFLRYMPIEYYRSVEQRKYVYSPILVDLLVNIGSHIDTFFRYWDKVKEKNQGIDINDFDIRHYRKIDDEIHLGNKKIVILASNEIIIPFNNWTIQRYPIWWKIYNDVKHQGRKYYKDANLDIIIRSLAGLFILICEDIQSFDILVKHNYIKHTVKYNQLMSEGFISEPYISSNIYGYNSHIIKIDNNVYIPKNN